MQILTRFTPMTAWNLEIMAVMFHACRIRYHKFRSSRGLYKLRALYFRYTDFMITSVGKEAWRGIGLEVRG